MTPIASVRHHSIAEDIFPKALREGLEDMCLSGISRRAEAAQHGERDGAVGVVLDLVFREAVVEDGETVFAVAHIDERQRRQRAGGLLIPTCGIRNADRAFDHIERAVHMAMRGLVESCREKHAQAVILTAVVHRGDKFQLAAAVAQRDFCDDANNRFAGGAAESAVVDPLGAMRHMDFEFLLEPFGQLPIPLHAVGRHHRAVRNQGHGGGLAESGVTSIRVGAVVNERAATFALVLEGVQAAECLAGRFVGERHRSIRTHLGAEEFVFQHIHDGADVVHRTRGRLLRHHTIGVVAERGHIDGNGDAKPGRLHIDRVSVFQISIESVVLRSEDLGADSLACGVENLDHERLFVRAVVAKTPRERDIDRDFHDLAARCRGAVENRDAQFVMADGRVVDARYEVLEVVAGYALTDVIRDTVALLHRELHTVDVATTDAVVLLVLEDFLPRRAQQGFGVGFALQELPCGGRLGPFFQAVLAIGIPKFERHTGRENADVERRERIGLRLHAQHFAFEMDQVFVGTGLGHFLADGFHNLRQAADGDLAVIDAFVDFLDEVGDVRVGVFLIEALVEKQMFG